MSWWEDGNSLALVEAMQVYAHNQDILTGGSRFTTTLNSSLIGSARQLGIPEDVIRDAFDSDRSLVIYEP